MANREERGTAAEQQATTRILGESGLEKRGSYSAMEPPKPLPKVGGYGSAGSGTAAQTLRTAKVASSPLWRGPTAVPSRMLLERGLRRQN